ncbi:MAG: FecR domain-containing protein [Pseudomonas sp.]
MTHATPAPDLPLAQAREWLVLLHSGRATAADQAQVQAWREASAQNADAMAQVEGLWALLGEVKAPVTALPVAKPRRRAARWGVPLAAAAALLLAVWLPQGVWLGLYADYHTRPGEVREVRLDDGSVLTLNGDTALDWTVSAGRREVKLYRGEADFQVAHDANQPFFVLAGPAQIRVTGTRFDVNYSGDEQVQLAVSQGQVQVSDGRQAPQLINARQQIAWHNGALQSVEPLDEAQRLAWQRGKLVFRSRPLAQVFGEWQRVQGDRVMFLDERARAMQITGVFASNDPAALLKAIESNLPVRVVQLPGLLLVASRDAVSQ